MSRSYERAMMAASRALDASIKRRQTMIEREKTLQNTLVAALAVTGAAFSVFGCYYLLGKKKSNPLAFEKEQSLDCIYLDSNGTTAIYKEVVESMIPYLTTHFGNPSSSHIMGQEPKRAINQARRSLLDLLGAPLSTPLSTIWFTGCGTEADNLAIQLALQSNTQQKAPHIVTSNVEHPAIEAYLKYLQNEAKHLNVSVTYVPVQDDCRVKASDVIAAIQDNTILVTVMLAQNETGAVQPIQEIATECRKRGILMHTDAAQAAGKISVDLVQSLGDPDMVSLVGHKLGAPKGIAALYVRDNCLAEYGRKLSHSHGIVLIGGGQEFGRRGGTENTPYIVGLGTAAALAKKNLESNSQLMESNRSFLIQQFTSLLGDDNILVHGPTNPEHRLPNTLSIGFKNVHSGELLNQIGTFVAASAGSACHSSGGAVSAVLQAMHIPMEFARGTLRLSTGPKTTRDELERASHIIVKEIKRQWQALEATAKSQ